MLDSGRNSSSTIFFSVPLLIIFLKTGMVRLFLQMTIFSKNMYAYCKNSFLEYNIYSSAVNYYRVHFKSLNSKF